ncbi:MAG: C40 family peptidase [Pyrinomonadaceae bacterium]
MTFLKRITFLSLVTLVFGAASVTESIAQDRERVAKPVMSRPVNQPKTDDVDNTRSTISSKPTNAPPLSNELVVNEEYKESLVKKTSDSRSTSLLAKSAGKGSLYASSTTSAMMRSIQSKIGIPYRYGSTGPNRYDCSGFVWSVFADAGIDFTRQSARSLWNASVPVEGDERFKFGTLVFLNRLGHMGIVADEKGFYHASSSKGITYSTFEGYWENRIVGFRRLVPNAAQPNVEADKEK